MSAAEVATDEPTEESMEETDDPQYQRDMDAFDEGENTGVASQFMTELAKGSQAFLCLGDKVGIALKGAEAQGIVDVGDGNMVGAQLFAEEHVLVAIVAEALIEGVGEHQVATDEEISGMEVAIGILLTSLCGMLVLGSLLVLIAEIALERIGIATNGYATIDDVGPFH